MGHELAGVRSLVSITFCVLQPGMTISASDLWRSDMIAYRYVGRSAALENQSIWVDHLPPLCLHTLSGIVVLGALRA